MDCCPSRSKPEVFRTAPSLDIIIVLIPAKRAWLVQPLDAHVFNLCERALRNKISSLQLQEANGQISVRHWWFAMTERVRFFIPCQPWASAFAQTGWTNAGDGVSKYLVRQLEWDCLPAIPTTVPAVERLREILPRARMRMADGSRWRRALSRALARQKG